MTARPRLVPALVAAVGPGTDFAGPPEALGELRRPGIPLVIVPDPATNDGPAEKIRAVAADVAEEPAVTGSATLDPETLLAAAPDVLLVPSAGVESVGGIDGVLSVPGVAGTPAGQARRVLAYDDQPTLGGGPRSGQVLARLVGDLHDGGQR